MVLMTTLLSFLLGGVTVILFEVYRIGSFFDGFREALTRWLPGGG